MKGLLLGVGMFSAVYGVTLVPKEWMFLNNRIQLLMLITSMIIYAFILNICIYSQKKSGSEN